MTTPTNEAGHGMPERALAAWTGKHRADAENRAFLAGYETCQSDMNAALALSRGVPEGTWLWGKLMDWCRSQGTSPANFDSLFAIASEAHKLYSAPAAAYGGVRERYPHSTHHVHRGPESLPCYCAATEDHQIGEESRKGEALARRFHETYERLAPSFGYETRTETRAFDPTTPNGRLMIAVCERIETALSSHRQAGEPLAWCALTTAGTIAYFDGRPMLMVGPVGNEHHTVPLYTAPPPGADLSKFRELAEKWRTIAGVCGEEEYSDGARDAFRESACELLALVDKGVGNGR